MSYCLSPHCQKPQNPDSTKFFLACGSKLLLKERYRALQPIGEGTFGRTFLAVDEDRLKTRCAIKQFFPQVQEKAELEKATALFKQEAHRLHELGEHPQIPSLLASFEQGKHLYLVEELIEGNNLFQELQQRGAFSEEQIWELSINLLPVVQFVREQQVIHRDIKPENILLRSPQILWAAPGDCSSTPGKAKKGIIVAESPAVQGAARGGQFVLVDFGVAKHVSGVSEAKTGTITGTAGYAPIEQIRSGKAYPASDLYSLGVTCIHLLTGAVLKDLFDALECKWIWRSHLAQKGIKVSQKLTTILNKLLKDSVRERYQSAAEVLQDLVNFGQYPRSQIAYNYRTKIAINSAVTNSQQNTATAVSAAPPHNIPVAPSARNQKLLSHNWRCTRILHRHSDSVNAVAIDPQGNILASASDDKTIKLWNLQTGELIHTFFGHSATVDAVAIRERRENAG